MAKKPAMQKTIDLNSSGACVLSEAIKERKLPWLLSATIVEVLEEIEVDGRPGIENVLAHGFNYETGLTTAQGYADVIRLDAECFTFQWVDTPWGEWLKRLNEQNVPNQE